MATNYETVIGLEVHVELSTQSKIFCGCTTAFGGEPNTHVCPVCMGMPGSLPVLNKRVLEYAVRAGVALNCDINRYNKFDRKNYFYPDLPKAYQTSQLYLPVCRNGWLQIQAGNITKKIGITEIHMEEDAGKLIHDPWDDCTLIDFNRCGVPLIEIVSAPDFRSANEAVAYLEKLRETLLYLEISDCKMQEGSMRADVNLSVRPHGAEVLGTRTEMKNLNSFKAIHRAIQCETRRQIELLEAGGKVTQETRRWDDNKDASFAMRSKENAQDYRYFPEPDLLPICMSEEWLQNISSVLPELAEQKRERYVTSFGLPPYDAGVLTAEKPLAELFEQTIALCDSPKEAANLITGEILRLMKETNTPIDTLNVDPAKLSALIRLVEAGTINRTIAKTVLEEVYHNNTDPEQYIREHGLAMIDDDAEINAAISLILQDNAKSLEDYHSGKEKAFGFLIGQTMKVLKGKANPQTVNRLLKERLTADR